MTGTDVNVALVFVVVCGALAALLVLVDPKLSGWLGKLLWVHSCAQRAAREAYREETARLMGEAGCDLRPDDLSHNGGEA